MIDYEFDDLDRELIAKCRAVIEAIDDEMPLKDCFEMDMIEQDDIEEMARLLARIAEAAGE